MLADFRDLNLSEPTLRSLAAIGFEAPTPVQARAIPCLLEGRDVIAQALTGTGKTAAFGVPIVERVHPGRLVPQAVVLAPTRELAIQVTDQLCKLGRHRHLEIVPIYGGQPIGRQLQILRRGVHVVVATPGRLLDHLRRGTVDLSNITTLILDEADQMLEMGFIDDVEAIINHLPAERVTALFSATMPAPIVELSRRYMRDPEMIRLSQPTKLTAPDIGQVYYLVPFARKLDALCRVLDARQPERTIVFCATRRMVDEVVEGLHARGYQAEGLHGDMSQAVRERVLRAFRTGQAEVLVGTDVAARGLDIPEVTHVINFDIPPDPEYYVHRIGRTGRFGRRGEAITFVNPREMRSILYIERVTGAHIRREEVPTVAEVEEREAQALEERLLASLANGGWGRYRPIVEELFEDHDPIDVAAAALGLAAERGAARARSVSASARAEGAYRAEVRSARHVEPRTMHAPERPTSERISAPGAAQSAAKAGRRGPSAEPAIAATPVDGPPQGRRTDEDRAPRERRASDKHGSGPGTLADRDGPARSRTSAARGKPPRGFKEGDRRRSAGKRSGPRSRSDHRQ
ncbi:MAG: DEAD/DEAH box helicase [Chloroflexi bacterium]|nr:DEAD/DEAH box helicase [Chloroflexota bacterium]